MGEVIGQRGTADAQWSIEMKGAFFDRDQHRKAEEGFGDRCQSEGLVAEG